MGLFQEFLTFHGIYLSVECGGTGNSKRVHYKMCFLKYFFLESFKELLSRDHSLNYFTIPFVCSIHEYFQVTWHICFVISLLLKWILLVHYYFKTYGTFFWLKKCLNGNVQDLIWEVVRPQK